MSAISSRIGDYIEVYLNGQLIANGTDCKIDFKFGKVKTTTKSTTSKANTYDYTDSDYTISGSALYATKNGGTAASMKVLSSIINAAKSNTKFTVKFGSQQSGEDYYTGTVLVDSASFNAPQKAEPTINYSFSGDGDWTESTNP